MDKQPAENQKPARGLVVRGSRNLFTVRISSEKRELQCRIKGKVLKGVEGYYNPLVPGDLVEVEDGLILTLEKRRNEFVRFNQKGQAPQILAANVDLVLCVTSLASPPWRPRFVDRALLQADIAGIPAAIICNKYDLAGEETGSSEAHIADPDIEERLSDFERIGYPVFRLSVLTGHGIPELERFIRGKCSVLIGQSGVGKSSLVKALIPDLEIKTGAVNEKFDRGNHVTSQGILFELPAGNYGGNSGTRIIDTPGIRRFVPAGIGPDELILYVREFAPLAGKCSYGLSCSHETEPGCKILEAISAGVILEDRWDSFLRIRRELSGARDYPDND